MEKKELIQRLAQSYESDVGATDAVSDVHDSDMDDIHQKEAREEKD